MITNIMSRNVSIVQLLDLCNHKIKTNIDDKILLKFVIAELIIPSSDGLKNVIDVELWMSF